MADSTLEDLFQETLKDIYYAEKKILKALPKMASSAQSAELKAGFEAHLVQTEAQVDRLEQVFDLIGVKAAGKECPAIDGIIEEGEEVIETFDGTPVLDAGLIAAAQAVEHYEIARYGSLCAWATILGMDEAAALLQETLDEEIQTDLDLSDLAEESVNEAALAAA